MAAQWRIQILESGEPAAGITLSEGNEAVLGRDPSVDLVLAERSVSRRHCRLCADEEGVRVLDLGSANGLYMGGRRIKEALLKPGDEVQIGLARVVVSRTTPQTGLIPVTTPDEATVLSSRDEGGQGMRPTQDLSAGTRSVLESNKDAYKNLEKERLALLIEAGRSLAGAIDVDTLLAQVMDQLFQLLPVRRGALALLTEDGKLEARITRPHSDEQELSRFCSQNIIRQVIESGQPRIIEDASVDQAFNSAQSILVSNVKAAICAPLISHTRTIGALYADYPGRARLYTPTDLEFFGAFANFAAVAIENARMVEELRERERLQRDLEIAAEIQQGIFPDLAFERQGMEVDWAYWPSRHVGGDFYDCLTTDDGRVVLLLGDVSGKSIGAALFMAQLMSAMRATVPEDPAPSRVMTRVNRLIRIRADRVFFATACYMVVNPEQETMAYSSAGHNPPLILEKDTDHFRELPATGIPLGVLAGYEYEEKAEPLPKGSLLVLYTDGIVEARDRDGNMFGMDATREILLRFRSEPPKAITAALVDAVREHCRDSSFVRDDIALMVVRT